MKAFVTAAEPGTRLQPLTAFLPKSLLPVANRPVLHRLLDLLRRHGVTEVDASVGPFADVVRDYFGDGSALGLAIHWSEEGEPVRADERALVVAGDCLHDVDLTDLIREHERTGVLATLVVKPLDDPGAHRVVLTDPTGEIVGLERGSPRHEGRSSLVSCGIAVVEPQVLARERSGSPGDVWAELAAEPGGLRAYPTMSYWSGLESLEELRRASLDAVAGRVRVEIAGDEFAPGVRCEDGCTIAATATLEGPLAIGFNVAIEGDAVVHGPATIGANSRIGAGATVAGAVLLAGSVVPDDGLAVGGLFGDASHAATSIERYPAGTSRSWN
jgi:mannose-1-phosphate guanylyltransferase/phosphomannomutase